MRLNQVRTLSMIVTVRASERVFGERDIRIRTLVVTKAYIFQVAQNAGHGVVPSFLEALLEPINTYQSN
jgi:hypothetical protein